MSGHYKVGGIETIDVIKAKLNPEQFKGFLLGNIIKYSTRCQHKGAMHSDLVKMEDYSLRLREAIRTEAGQ